MRFGLRIFVALTVVSGFQAAEAFEAPQFDVSRRTVLHSEDAKTILQWYAPDTQWTMSDWNITSEDLDRLELSLGKVLVEAKVGTGSTKVGSFYRQYMPARWNGLRLIVVNGFDKTNANMFPDKGIDSNEWKRNLTVVFGGGCGYWRAVYVVEKHTFMTLRSEGHSARVLCNAPK